ncbi:ficolin-1-like [Physella acuta]|uniref:ficolin-1-like n=1 Tax=Physella acuta TaxID=109671 RepID=UPI0027DE3118|nr:ficolin-1-like [Physella acuta]
MGDVNFTRGWDDYKHGFGSTAGDFWLGNDWISWLTHVGYTDLRIDLTIESTNYYAVYNNFKVDDESSKYFMTFLKYEGNTKDQLSPHKNMKFSTTDNDNDADGRNCAQSFMGGWWYTNCYQTNLNGVWNINDNTGMFWGGYVKSVEMKLRTF